MDRKIFRFKLDNDDKKNGKAIYGLIMNLKAKAPKTLEVEPLEEPKYSGKIAGIILKGIDKDILFAGEKLVKYLLEKKITYTEDGIAKNIEDPAPSDETAQSPAPSGAGQRDLKSGIAFYHLGLYDDSLVQLMKVSRTEPDNYLALQHIGLIHEQKEDYEKALSCYKRSLEIKEDVSATHFFIGNAHQKLGNYDKAIEEYKNAIRLDPEIPLLYNNLAWAFYQTGDFDRAIRAFEEAINLDPDLPFPYNGLGYIYQEMGYLEEAVEEFSQAIDIFPEYAAARLKLGWVYYQMGNYDKAAAEFNAVIETAGDGNYLESAHYSLANTFLAQNLLEEAYEEFLQVIKRDPNFVDSYFHLGVICSKLAMYDQAVAYLDQCVQKNSQFKDQAHVYSALSYASLRKFDEALDACQRALAVEPNDPEIYNILGTIYSYKEDWARAIEKFKKALDFNPHSARAGFNLALAYENNNDLENAVKYYKNAISIDQNFLEAYTNLGWLYLDQQKNDEGLVLFERAVELKSDDPELLNNLGWAYSNLGKYEQALEQYRKARKLNPRSASIYNNLGVASYHIGNYDEAYKYFQESLKLDEKEQNCGYARFYLGLIYQKQEKFKEALEELVLARKLDKDNVEILYRMGQCYEKLSNKNRAHKLWEEYLAGAPDGEFVEEIKGILKK